MENVLDVYQRPEVPAAPVVCVDETSKQHLKDVRGPYRASSVDPAALILSTPAMA